MIDLHGIYTIRDSVQPSFWDIVFEWEDQFSKTLGIPLLPVGEKYKTIYTPGTLKKLLNRLDYYRLKDKYSSAPDAHYLAFHIGPPGVYSFYGASNVIPIIIDFWKNEDLKKFQRLFSLNRCVVVTSMEVYNYLKDHRVNVRLLHSSLSLPDKYQEMDTSSKRTIDVIQFGRQNQKLSEYMGKFLAAYPDIHYVHATNQNGRLTMISNQLGELKNMETRSSFMNLLANSRVSLVSAPGIDEGISRTGGFSPVTPRFLESAACGCKMIGRYTDNIDFKYNRINEVCRNVGSYDEFKSIMEEFLSNNDIPDYKEFLKNNLSSLRATELQRNLSAV